MGQAAVVGQFAYLSVFIHGDRGDVVGLEFGEQDRQSGAGRRLGERVVACAGDDDDLVGMVFLFVDVQFFWSDGCAVGVNLVDGFS